MASIDLRFRYDNNEPQVQAYDLEISVLNAVDMPEEVFVINQGVAPIYEHDSTPGDLFTSVADPLDLEEYPAGPPANAQIPFYRTAQVTLRFRSYAQLLQTKQLIVDDLQGLVSVLNNALANPGTEDVTIA